MALLVALLHLGHNLGQTDNTSKMARSSTSRQSIVDLGRCEHKDTLATHLHCHRAAMCQALLSDAELPSARPLFPPYWACGPSQR
jgi:hypothetical protein